MVRFGRKPVKFLIGTVLFSVVSMAGVPEAPHPQLFLDKLPLRFEQSPAGDGYEARGSQFNLQLQASENVLEWTDHGNTARVLTRLVGGNRSASIAAEDRLPGAANYFI